jgi:hypothetical protein
MCQICMEPMNDIAKVYKLSECNHDFHTDCIVNWFRNDSPNCISCYPSINQPNFTLGHDINPANAQVNYDLYGLPYISLHQQPQIPFAQVSRQARKKDAPDVLKKLYKRYQQVRLKYTTANKAYSEYRKTDDYPKYRTLRKQFRKISFKALRLKWKLKRIQQRLISEVM